MKSLKDFDSNKLKKDFRDLIWWNKDIYENGKNIHQTFIYWFL